jgi:hypothetical protein
MHRVTEGVGVQQAAPRPVQHRPVDELLCIGHPLGNRALAHGPGHPLRKWQDAHRISVLRGICSAEDVPAVISVDATANALVSRTRFGYWDTARSPRQSSVDQN